MKKIFILALAALMLLASTTLAEVPAEMKIVNCEEWVSLRAEPDSSAQRFAEVKLGETVRGFYGSNGDFTQCAYDGAVGYILTEYLEVMGNDSAASIQPEGEPAHEFVLENGSVRVWKGLNDWTETMFVGRYDAQDELLWSYATESLGTTELDSLSAFINTRATQPMVMVYNSYYGLTALDMGTGVQLWTLPCTEVSLGGSIVYAVGEDGTMYIGGYYGPDPVAVSAEGKVMFQSVQDETYFYWMTEITPTEDGIAVSYDNGGNPVIASYDMEGKMTGHEPGPVA